jgi:hypothetical protein
MTEAEELFMRILHRTLAPRPPVSERARTLKPAAKRKPRAALTRKQKRP